jgi:hypothetical protein
VRFLRPRFFRWRTTLVASWTVNSQRKRVNEWYDNTLRNRLNKEEEGAIILIM